MVALLTSVRNSPCFGGLRRTKTCHWQLFARPSMLFGYFLHDAKSRAKNFVTFLRKVCPCRDGTLRVLFFAAPRPLFRRLCRLSVACRNESPPAVCRRRFVSLCGGVFAGTANNLCLCQLCRFAENGESTQVA